MKKPISLILKGLLVVRLVNRQIFPWMRGIDWRVILVISIVLPISATAENPLPTTRPQAYSAGSPDRLQIKTVEARKLSQSDLSNLFYRAMKENDIDKVRQVLAQGFDLHGEYAYSVLIDATKDGRSEIVRILLDAGANVHTKGDKTRTALMYAAMGGQTDIVKMLLDKGANPNDRNDYPYQFRLEGTSPNRYHDNQMSALMYAAKGGYTHIVEVLAAAGAKINAKDYYDETALMFAASSGHADTVLKLIELGADIHVMASDKERRDQAYGMGDDYGGTALLYAVRNHKFESAKLLLASYIRQHASIEERELVLLNAIDGGDLDLVKLLEGQGADTAKPVLLSVAASRATLDVFKYLLDKKTEEEFRSGQLYPSILTSAAESGDLVKVKLVLDHGMNVNVRDGGQNALYYAVSKGAEDVVAYLLGKGIEVNVTGDISLSFSGMGDTPLALAVQNDSIGIVKQLLAAGADINLKGKKNRNGMPPHSALEVANIFDRSDVLLMFVAADRPPANILPVYLRGRSPYQIPELVDANLLFWSGEKLYAGLCTDCHRVDGTAGKILSLREEQLRGKSKQTLISAVMQGHSTPHHVPKEEFQSLLQDADLASILTYVSKAWGNDLDMEVQPRDVKAARTSSPTIVQNALIIPGKQSQSIIQQLYKLGYLYTDNMFVEAVRRGDRNAVQLFLDAGINPAAKGAKGKTALSVAVSVDNGEIAKMLIETGVDMNTIDSPSIGGESAPWVAARDCHGKNLAMRAMLEAGLDPNLVDFNGNMTLLMRASSSDCMETAQALIDHGADVSRELRGSTALKIAKIYGKNVVPVLRAAGAKE
jgi:ankyrin repeat protein